MEEKLQLVQRTLRDLVRFNTDKEDLNLDVAFILASNDDELIDFKHAEELNLYSDKLYTANGSHSNLNIDSDFIFNLLSFIKE